jgi:hypothetical protein
MKYGILGATGPTGLELIKQLPDQQCSVYVRSPGKLPQSFKGEVIQGQLSETEKLKTWAAQQDIIFIVLGHRLSLAQIKANLGLSKTYGDRDLLKRCIEIVISARPRRIVYCSAYGTHETRADLPFVFGKILLPLLIAESYRDHEQAETLLRASPIEWVIARPGMLTNEAGRGKYLTQNRFAVGGPAKISRADVAHFMIKASEGNAWLRQSVGLRY